MESEIRPDIAEGNRHCWKLGKVLSKSLAQADVKRMSSELYDIKYSYAILYDENNMLNASMTRNSFNWPSGHHISKILFSVRFGVCEESEEEIAVSENHKIFDCTSRILDCIPLHRSEVDSIMQTNDLFFFVEVATKIQDIDTHIKLERDYEKLLLSGENSDVTIEVQCKKFECHRIILAARSPVFSAMFTHDMKEKNSRVMKIQDVEPTTFYEFLLYLYTGNEEHLNWVNVTELYGLADRYAVEDLKNISLQHIENNISTKNFLKFFHLTQQHKESKLSAKIVRFFLKNWKRIIERSEWLSFMSENPVESNVLIKALGNKQIEPRSDSFIRLFLYST